MLPVMNNDKINLKKIKLRKEAKKKLENLTYKEKVEKDTLINERIYCFVKNMEPENIGVYYPIKNEVSVLGLTARILKENYSVFYPRFIQKHECNSGYQMSKVTDLNQLKPGLFNIPEPPQSSLTVKSSEIDLWLIPGLAFSPDGIRLGRGGGYYDRLLAGTGGIKAGILYECQLMPDIPFESHDICMNILVMENKTLMIC